MESVQGLVNIVKTARAELDTRIEEMVDKYIGDVESILEEFLLKNPHCTSNSCFAVPLGHINLKEGSFSVEHTVMCMQEKEHVHESFSDLMSEEYNGEYPGYEEYVGYELIPFLQALKNRGFYYIGVDNDDGGDCPILPFFEA